MEEMISSMYGRTFDVNQTVVEPAMRVNELAFRTQGLIAEKQFAMMETCLGVGARQLRAAAEAKDPKDFVSRQAELAAELGEKLVVTAREMYDIQAQAGDELGQLIRDGFEKNGEAASKGA